MSGQIDAPPSLFRQKHRLQICSGHCGGEKCLVPSRVWNPNRPVSSQVAIPTALTRLHGRCNNRGTGWRWTVSMPRPLYRRGNHEWCPLCRMLRETQNLSARLARERNLCPYRNSNPTNPIVQPTITELAISVHTIWPVELRKLTKGAMTLT